MRLVVAVLVGCLAAATGASAPAPQGPDGDVTASCDGGPQVRTSVDVATVRIVVTGAGRRSGWGGSASSVATYADGTGVSMNASLALRSDARGRIVTALQVDPGGNWTGEWFISRYDGRADCRVRAWSGD